MPIKFLGVNAIHAAVLVTGLAAAYVATQPGESDLARFAPTTEYQRRGDFLLAFDGMTRCPRWTLERLTSKSIEKHSDRAGVGFHADPHVPVEFAPVPSDYAGSGFDLGHQAAAANHETTADNLRETFTVANAVPQTPELNRGPWRFLEAYLRESAKNNPVWIITAPIWKPGGYRESDGRKVSFLKFSAIGKHTVWVPTHCGKAVLIEHIDGTLEAHAWVLPNNTNPPAFDECLVTTDEFEKLTGLDVWSALPDATEKNLESEKR